MKKIVTALFLSLLLVVISCTRTEQNDEIDNEILELLVGNKWIRAYEQYVDDYDFNYWANYIYDFTSPNKVRVAHVYNITYNYDGGYPMYDGFLCCNEDDFIYDEESYDYIIEDYGFRVDLYVSDNETIPDLRNLKILDENTILLDEYEFLIRFNGFDPDHLNRISLNEEKTEYLITEKQQTEEIYLHANFQFDVIVDPSCSSWISHIETTGKADNLSYGGANFTTILDIANNTGKERIGKVRIGKGDVFCEIKIIQTRAVPEPEPNQIIYKTTDGSKIESPYLPQGPKIVSHEYEDGYGTITFESELNFITQQAFNFRKTLLSIKLPERVYLIGHDAFANCECLADVGLPKELERIEYRAFYSCNIKVVVLPEKVKWIEGSAFGSYGTFGPKIAYFTSVDPPNLDGLPFGSTIRTIYVPNKSLAKYMKVKYLQDNANKVKGYDY